MACVARYWSTVGDDGSGGNQLCLSWDPFEKRQNADFD